MREPSIEPSGTEGASPSLLPTSPRERGVFLKSLADFQTELFRVVAGFIPVVRRWELKRELAEVVFRDARRAQDLRTRCRELGVHFSGSHLSRSVPGLALLELLCKAPNAETAFSAIFLIVKPALRRLLQESLREELRVFDAPSVPVVEANLSELDRQITWASRKPEAAGKERGDWLDAVAAAAGSLFDPLEAGGKKGTKAVRAARRVGNLPFLASIIPDGFSECPGGTPPPAGTDYASREQYHAHNFLMEVQASDSCASLLFDAPDMPWEFYFDLARHLWDETRHCEFGEMKLQALGHDIRQLGISNTAYGLRQTLAPLDRYAALTTQEADAFPGKHAGLRDALHHHDELSARAWSYDIADETQHVRYGHKWIPVMIEATGEPRSYEQLKRDAENWRRDVLGAAYAPTARSFAGAGK